MKNIKNKRTIILAIILLGLLIIAYKVIFAPTPDALIGEENIAASSRVTSLLQQVEGINFDTSMIQDGKFQSLKDIETPLPSLPVGRANPFSVIFGSK